MADLFLSLIHQLKSVIMKALNYSLVILLCLLLAGCNLKDKDSKLYDISGIVQKGPFINGSEIVVYELSSSLNPTGKTFHGTTNNIGRFEISSIPLESPYVELIANGFYLNEVTGELSSAPVTLNAIVNLEGKDAINVNVLTNLEYRRIKYLINTKELSFDEAKEQANNEILSLFSFEANALSDPELLDITAQGDDNAILLAISAILQGSYSTAEMSKNMSDIITDMETDGVLDSPTLKSMLSTQAFLLNADLIVENLITGYSELGLELTAINNFQEKIDYFISNSGGEIQTPFEFPESTQWGNNLLVGDSLVLQTQKHYCIAVEMPSSGVFAVKIKIIEGNGSFYFMPLQAVGFTNTQFDFQERSQIYTSTANNDLIYVPMLFEGYGVASLQIFFNDVEVTTLAKNITWGGYNDSDFYFEEMNRYGKNILTLPDNSELFSDSVYCVSINSINDFDIDFELLLPDDNTTINVTGGYLNYSYEILSDRLNFNLKGNTTTEIMFKLNGEGPIHLNSNLPFRDGTFLTRTYHLKK